MEYCIVEDGVIVNMIVAEADFAREIGALPVYEGAAIGGAYAPPPPEPEPLTTDERLEKLESKNKLLREQVSAQADQAEFYGEKMDELLKRVDDGEIIIPSSTAGSTKKFKLTVDDSGTVSATEVTS